MTIKAFVARDGRGRICRYTGQHYLSPLPIRDLIHSLNPPSPKIVAAAEALRYHEFLTVVLIVDRSETFSDT